MKEIKDSIFLSSYRDQSITLLEQLHPEWDKKEVRKIVEKEMLKSFRNPDARIENSYTHEAKDVSLLSVIDWALETKPIIAANGTFFKQHAVSKNPNADMLIGFLDQRKQIKSEMFAIEDETSRLYKMKDLRQSNKKKLANS